MSGADREPGRERETAVPVARFRIESGADRGRLVELHEGETLTFGRDAATEVRINDPAASRAHFKVKGHRGQPWIKDLQSRNGTFVNGARVDEAKLAVGDEVRVGETTILVEASPETESNGSEPEPLDPSVAAALIAERMASAGAAPGASDDTPTAGSEDPAAADRAVAEKRDRLIGRTIAGYRIEALKGRGGMGTVYRAVQLSLNREVALKVLSSRLTRDATFVDLFFREARAAGQLNHPNIVQVYDVGQDETESLYFYSMEFVDGGSLQGRIDADGKLSVEESARAMLEAARGLLYAEKKRLVHRDIKPDNLMIGEGGIVKIADLGLAKSLTEGPRGEEGILGTPHFISPEQAQGKEVDTRSDLYSLGASFYRILTGQNPYPGKTVKEIILQRLKVPPRPVREIDPEVPEDFARIVERLMQRDPAERYQSAEDLVADLEEMIRVHHYGRGSRKGLYAAIALAVVAVGVAIGVVATRNDGEGQIEYITQKDPETERKLAEEREKAALATTRYELSEIKNAELSAGLTEAVASRYEAFAKKNEAAVSEALRALVREATGSANRIREAIRAEAERVAAEKREIAAAVDALEKSVEDAIGRKEIAKAWREMEPAEIDLEGRKDFATRLDALRQKVRDEAAKLVAAAKDDVAKLSRELKYRPALDGIDAAHASLLVPGVETQPFAELLAELSALRADVAEARERDAVKQRDLDRDELVTRLRAALACSDEYRFEAAAEEVRSLPDQLGTDPYRDLARRWAESFHSAARLMGRAVAVASERLTRGETVEIPLSSSVQRQDRARLRAIDPSRVEVEIAIPGGPPIVQPFDWKDYKPAAQLVAALEAAIGAPTAEDRRDAVHLLLLLQDVSGAAAALAKLSPDDASAPDLRFRLGKERRALETLALARSTFQDERHNERTLEALRSLQEELADTQAYFRGSDGTSHYAKD